MSLTDTTLPDPGQRLPLFCFSCTEIWSNLELFWLVKLPETSMDLLIILLQTKAFSQGESYSCRDAAVAANSGVSTFVLSLVISLTFSAPAFILINS